MRALAWALPEPGQGQCRWVAQSSVWVYVSGGGVGAESREMQRVEPGFSTWSKCTVRGGQSVSDQHSTWKGKGKRLLPDPKPDKVASWRNTERLWCLPPCCPQTGGTQGSLHGLLGTGAPREEWHSSFAFTLLREPSSQSEFHEPTDAVASTWPGAFLKGLPRGLPMWVRRPYKNRLWVLG
jgi:hypothetical protein